MTTTLAPTRTRRIPPVVDADASDGAPLGDDDAGPDADPPHPPVVDADASDGAPPDGYGAGPDADPAHPPLVDADASDGAPSDAAALPTPRPECLVWLPREGEQAVPAGAVGSGFELAYDTWPGTGHQDAHYICGVEHQQVLYPAKLVDDSQNPGRSYGCYAYIDGVLSPRAYSVLTLAPGCEVEWVRVTGALPTNAVVVGQRGAVPVVPCKAPVSPTAFPLSQGDDYHAHASDTHLGHVLADQLRCYYEFVGNGYWTTPQTGNGFEVPVWRSP